MNSDQPPSLPISQRFWLRRWINRLEVDRATFYALLTRIWQFAASPVTMLLIAAFFTPELQGYFYVFHDFLYLQLFVELGISSAVVHFASHEWAKLKLDDRKALTGDPAALSRLVSLGRMAILWYAVAVLLFFLVVGSLGWQFLSSQAGSEQVTWKAPWLTLVALISIVLLSHPLTALLEGCHQVAFVQKFHTVQAMVGHLAIWTAISSGAGLWASAIVAGVRLIWIAILLFGYRHFFRVFLQVPQGERIPWRTEVWPLQWRIGCQLVLNLLMVRLFTIFAMQYHGPVVAGQMGMTWNALTAAQLAAFAWVQTRTPYFGSLIAEQDFPKLNRIFRRLMLISTTALFVACTLICSGVWFLNELRTWNPETFFWPEALRFLKTLSPRVLAVKPTLWFAAGILLYHVPQCQWVYLRAHKRDPLLKMTAVVSLLTATAVWWSTANHNLTTTGIVFTLIMVSILLPWSTLIWHRSRQQWQA